MKPAGPLRFALWLLERSVPAGEAMAGDLIEQFRKGRSAWWMWRQVVTTTVVGLIEMFFEGEGIMKRRAIGVLVLLLVFSFGFWAGKSPSLEMVFKQRLANQRKSVHSYSVIVFLQDELDNARARNLQENTKESELRVQDLERKLADAWRFESKREQ